MRPKRAATLRERLESTSVGRDFFLNRIKRLLSESDLPLETFSQLTGFKTHAHMSVVFKKVTGMTPGRFRVQPRRRPMPAAAPGPIPGKSPDVRIGSVVSAGRSVRNTGRHAEGTFTSSMAGRDMLVNHWLG